MSATPWLARIYEVLVAPEDADGLEIELGLEMRSVTEADAPQRPSASDFAVRFPIHDVSSFRSELFAALLVKRRLRHRK